MLLASTALHLQMCELRVSPPISVTATVFKLNFEWPMRSEAVDFVDVGYDWKQSGILPEDSQLGDFLWHAGPTVYFLSDVLKARTLARVYPVSDRPNMGPLAAIHLSSPADPVGTWLKSGGGVEFLDKFTSGTAVPATVLAAARARTSNVCWVCTRWSGAMRHNTLSTSAL